MPRPVTSVNKTPQILVPPGLTRQQIIVKTTGKVKNDPCNKNFPLFSVTETDCIAGVTLEINNKFKSKGQVNYSLQF